MDAIQPQMIMQAIWSGINIYYDRNKKASVIKKKRCGWGFIQWAMRSYKSLDDVTSNKRVFVLDAVSGYRSDFGFVPRIFLTLPWWRRTIQFVRVCCHTELAKHTPPLSAVSPIGYFYNINIIQVVCQK